MFAQIVVLERIDAGRVPRTFTYSIPEHLESQLTVGHLAIVPFGARRLPGIVVALIETSPVRNTKPIEALLDPLPALSPVQFELALWIAKATLAPLHECLDLFLPPGIQGRTDTRYALAVDDVLPKLSATQSELMALLKRRGPLRSAQIDRALHGKPWQTAMRSLVRRDLIDRQPVLLPPSVRPKRVRFARLIADPAEVATARSSLSTRPEVNGRRARVLDYLTQERGPVWVSWVYAETGANLADLQMLAERDLISLSEEEMWRDPLSDKDFVPTEPPTLTRDQALVWEQIRPGLNTPPDTYGTAKPHRYLLYGITGSGKTEIYLRAVHEVLAQNKQAIILVPEIALTPQTVRRFAARFPGRVSVMHSGLNGGERYDVWRRARAGAIDVIVGPRSAIFAPLNRLGLIVLDEEHEASFKQEHRPFYHAREGALEMARLTGAATILGSATPSLESWAHALRGEYQLLTLPHRILGHVQYIEAQQSRYHIQATAYRPADADAARYAEMPKVEIVDLRAEIKSGNPHIFSRRLQSALSDVLARGEQAILFLNRRGAATFVMCRDCGPVLNCPRCEWPLTYHESVQPSTATPMLICHTCNRREPQPARCPECGSTRIRYFGSGTQKVERELADLFPAARILRWDRDTTTGKGSHELILQAFIDRQADILVGTQMIAKGLDLPLVTLVGVISADTNLHLPDFRSSERTFQLLAQGVGRAGRSLLGGRAIIQTYAPDHYAVETAAQHDYEAFAQRELEFRRQVGYPPYTRLARLLVRDVQAGRAQQEAEKIATELDALLTRKGIAPGSIIGPAPCFFAKIRDQYRWHIALRHPDPASVLHDLALPPNWRIDIDPMSML